MGVPDAEATSGILPKAAPDMVKNFCTPVYVKNKNA